MNLDSLKQYESSLEIIYSEDQEVQIPAICTLNNLSSKKLLFIKDKKFFERLLVVLEKDSYTDLIIITEKKSYLKLESRWNEIKSSIHSLMQVDNVPLAMCALSKPYFDEKFGKINDMVDGRQMVESSIHPTAWIAQGVFIGENVMICAGVKIHAHCVILNDSVIGENTQIYPNVSIYHNTVIGKNCRIHGGATIGSDGFGYNFDKGVHHKIWHMGGVIIHDDVEIGANSCVDQGTFAPTIIGEGVKLDNHVQIGHNVILGKAVVICGQVAIGGSTTIGDYTVFGGKSAAGPDVILGARSTVAGATMVNASWPEDSVLGGHPARPLKEWLRGIAYVRSQVKLKR